MLLCGMGIFAAVFVLGAAFQFVANDAVELQSAFTHGGRFLTQYPMSIYGREAVRALTFVLPMAFINWQPALYVLDRPDPTGLPSFLRFGAPVVAPVLLALAGLAWRTGLRRYRSTGS
jgi:ABC-2 type transport system permease protein